MEVAVKGTVVSSMPQGEQFLVRVGSDPELEGLPFNLVVAVDEEQGAVLTVGRTVDVTIVVDETSGDSPEDAEDGTHLEEDPDGNE